VELDGSFEARIIQLMPETPVSRFRINELARRRLQAMSKQTGKLVELAITNLRAALLHGAPVVMTIPDDPDDGPKAHKRGGRRVA
jgi:hypothetical protein